LLPIFAFLFLYII